MMHGAVCSVSLLVATVFSLLTMATGCWEWYIPTVLFAAVTIWLALWELRRG